MYQLVVLTLHKTHHSAEDTQDSKEAWPIPSSLMEGKDTPHCSPSQMGGLLSAATAPPLTTGAGLETVNASTVPSLPVKAHLTTVLAGGWSCRAPSVDRFLREGSPGDKQEQESKQGWVVLTNMELSCLSCVYSQPYSRWDTHPPTPTHMCPCTHIRTSTYLLLDWSQFLQLPQSEWEE